MLRKLASPFWNAEERRPRALVRLAAHGVLLAIVLLGSGMLAGALGPSLPAYAIVFGAQAMGVIAVTWIAARALDRRRFGDLGLRPRRGYATDVAFGALVGGICMAAIAVVEDSCGWAGYTPRVRTLETAMDALPEIGASFWVFVGVAVLEELISRGYHLTNLAEGLSRGRRRRHPVATIGALAISSAAFGLGHAGNPSATWASVVFITCGGVFLAIGYLAQGDLALPIGVHLGWNFFQNLLGMPVSGMTQFADAALFVRVEDGPDLVTGGAFGPEAGLTGLVAMALGIALSIVWVRARTGRVRIVARFGAAPSGPVAAWDQ